MNPLDSILSGLQNITRGRRLDGSFSKRGGPRDPKGYRGIIRGVHRAPLRDYIGVILRNTQIGLWTTGRGGSPTVFPMFSCILPDSSHSSPYVPYSLFRTNHK